MPSSLVSLKKQSKPLKLHDQRVVYLCECSYTVHEVCSYWYSKGDKGVCFTSRCSEIRQALTRQYEYFATKFGTVCRFPQADKV